MSCEHEHGHSHSHSHSHEHHHEHHHEHRHEGHGHHGHGYGRHEHGRPAEAREERRSTLKVKEGDILTCGCGDCNVELTVTKACQGDVCGTTGCEVGVNCCGEPMRLKAA